MNCRVLDVKYSVRCKQRQHTTAVLSATTVYVPLICRSLMNGKGELPTLNGCSPKMRGRITLTSATANSTTTINQSVVSQSIKFIHS
jgi:hypothetical protein